MQIVSIGDNLHEMSNLFSEKNKKNIVNFLPRVLSASKWPPRYNYSNQSEQEKILNEPWISGQICLSKSVEWIVYTQIKLFPMELLFGPTLYSKSPKILNTLLHTFLA